MGFNTAIFFDIENLLKGYSFSERLINNFSLKEIVERINQSKYVDKVAVQRAYANWSDPRMGVLKGEIIELGIEPIQVFGFSKTVHKNAADIQIAVDAIDLSFTRPNIDVYVLVTGDGGFSAIAKKMHEYGRTVIGCAYESSFNKVLQGVCDEIIWIEDPEEDEIPAFSSQNLRNNRIVATANSSLVYPYSTRTCFSAGEKTQYNDPRTIRLLQHIVPLRREEFSQERALAKVHEMLHWFTTDSILKSNLASGLQLSFVREAVMALVEGIKPEFFGFTKFMELMQYFCKDTPLAVFMCPPTEARLYYRNRLLYGAEQLPDLDKQMIHSVEGYTRIINTGVPIFRLPLKPGFQFIIDKVIELRHSNNTFCSLGEWIDRIQPLCQEQASEEDIKHTLLLLVSAECFHREPPGKLLGEQTIRVYEQFNTSEDIKKQICKQLRDKIIYNLATIQDDVFYELMASNGLSCDES